MSNRLLERIHAGLDRADERAKERLNPGELEVIEFKPMHAVTEPEQLGPALSDVMHSKLPGFVIEHSKEHPVIETDEAPHEAIAKALAQQGFNGFKLHRQYDIDKWYATEGRLFLETDEMAESDPWYVNELNVHETKVGSGPAVIAEAGPRFRRNWNAIRWTGSKSRNVFWRELHDDFLAGYVRPGLVRRRVYWTDAQPGDLVVFPSSNNNGPVLNRFDTGDPDHVPHCTDDFYVRNPWREHKASVSTMRRELPSVLDLANVIDPTNRFANLQSAARTALLTK